MSRSAVLTVVLPFVVAFALGFASFTMFRRGNPGRRPWWGSPWLWLGVCVISIVLGVLVWPWLFGGVFLFLPFVWIGRRPGGTRMDPRTNGHARSNGERR